MPAASILIKPTSSNCNIDCKYCFYKCLSSNREKYSLGFMSETTLEKLIKNAFEYGEGYLTFAFQGGEPTLAGIDFFKKALELQQKYREIYKKNLIRVENTIQTNGMVIDDEWARFFHDNDFLVGLSLDGPEEIHDDGRVDACGRGTFARVMETVALFKRYQVQFNILTVVTEKAANNAALLYDFYRANGFDYVQLIPCMDEVIRFSDGSEAHNPYAVKPKSYGRFLKEFFDLWYEDFRIGNIMDVRMFSNLAQMTVGYPPEECGMCGRCNCYFVVEGDGSVYPCDFYAFGDNKLGTVDDKFADLKESKKALDFEAASFKVEDECKQCKYYALCRGGCRRWRENDSNGQLGLNYLCEGYKDFYEYTWERLVKLGRTIIDPRARALL